MTGKECVELLQWALPRLRLRWRGFRNVRGQVCKRIARRVQELGLPNAEAYRRHLEANPPEWEVLRTLCRITITRFYRDHGVFAHLGAEVLPRLVALARAQGRTTIDVWCAGCAGGEEAYSLAILWQLGVDRPKDIGMRILATDIDPTEIERARRGEYPPGALRELPEELRAPAFEEHAGIQRVREPFRAAIEFRLGDLTKEMPDGPFDLVLCRNLAFTYFDEDLQKEVATRLVERLAPNGVLVLGKHETIPDLDFGRRFVRSFGAEPIYTATA